jgi:hypothetical protein
LTERLRAGDRRLQELVNQLETRDTALICTVWP